MTERAIVTHVSARPAARGFPGATGLRRLRLATGLTLFAYVGLHLLNHTLGNLSLAAMEAGLAVQKFVWQSPPGGVVLYAALAVHLLLGLWALYERRHFGWTAGEVVQLVLGLAIPPLLANHVVVTRVSLMLFGTEKGYAQELYSFWVKSPPLGVQQAAVLLVAWAHGCLGVYFWLRLRRFFPRAMPGLLCVATLLPVLALLGFFQAGRFVVAAVADPSWRAANLAPGQIGLPAQNALLARIRDASLAVGAALVGLVLLARGVRAWRERRGRLVRVSYPDGRSVRVPRGFSVLEASRAGRIAHVSVCGGRARCSTCRIRVLSDPAALPAAAQGEQAVLDRVRAGPGVRLACQARPRADIAVAPLVRPADALAVARGAIPWRGEERFIVALVVDMRDSVRLAETRMPFDAVFIIDRFITAVGDAVTQAGGHVNHFTGDGLIATFGLAVPPAPACRQALAAVAHVHRNVAALNAHLAQDRSEPIRFGVGVHGGPAVVGEIGYGAARVFTTLGDAANVAARLESLCKSFACTAVLSEDVCRLSGLDLTRLTLREILVRGRTAALLVRTLSESADLAAVLDRAAPVTAG